MKHRLIKMTLYAMSYDPEYDTRNIRGALQHEPVLFCFQDVKEVQVDIDPDGFDGHELNLSSTWDNSSEVLDRYLKQGN